MENKRHADPNPRVTRPVALALDLYTEGDEEYKKELAALMINNVREMRDGLLDAVYCNDPVRFDKVCHKVKVTLSILNDAELNSIIEALRGDMRAGRKGNDGLVRGGRFMELCDLIIASLGKETGGGSGS